VREEAKIGQRTTLDILDADAEEINARIAFAHAKRDELVAKFTLAKTLGILNADALVE